MKSKLEGTVTYLQFIDCTLNAEKQNEEQQNKPPQQQEESYLGLHVHQLTKPLKMKNRTSTDATFRGAWCIRMLIKQ